MDAGKKILLDLFTGSLRFVVGSARRFAHLGSCPSMGR